MKTIFSILVIFLLTNATTHGQGFGGGFGGGGSGASYQRQDGSKTQSQIPRANSSQATAAAGTAVVSVKPESLRLVFAVTADGETSQACAASIKTAITKINKALIEIEIPTANVVEDFINIERRHTWELRKVKFENDSDKEDEKNEDEDEEDDDTAKIVREIPDGFRMQTNLHVLCKDEEQALEVMDIAFKAGVNDIISFDYWHSDIDKYKKEALKLAIKEAKAKAEILLAVFDEKPKLLNVHSEAKIIYPESLYQTIESKSNNSMSSVPYSWRDYTKITAARPKITFYEGAKGYSDRSPVRPAMNPEIAIYSTVTLTYGNPVRDDWIELEKLRISNEANSK